MAEASLPPGVGRVIGSFNKLFPDFHGTTAEMTELWESFKSKLREMLPEALETCEAPHIGIARRVVRTSWDTDKELLVFCSVELQETDGVETFGRTMDGQSIMAGLLPTPRSQRPDVQCVQRLA